MENRARPSALVRKVLGPILEGRRDPQPLFATKEAARKYMDDAITKRRNDFIAEYRKGFHGSAVLTYEPALDREVYKELHQVYGESVHQIQQLRIANQHHQKEHLLETHAAAYEEALKGLTGYTRFQVETFIGERLNVGLSRYQYDLRDGVMYGQLMTEPLIAMIDRGRETRGIVGKNIDEPRQDAEVALFLQIQSVLGDPQTEIGTTILSFSPPGKKGSAYAHNFYDVFSLQEKDGIDGKKIRYVEARRYASGLSPQQSVDKAELLGSGYKVQFEAEGQESPDAFLISHPIVLEKGHEFFNQPDELHKRLQGDPKAISYDDFQTRVIKDSLFADMVQHYLDTLEHNPTDKKTLNKTLDAIMNRADEIVGLRGAVVAKVSRWRRQTSIGPLSITDHISTYSKEKVRQTSSGCGSSGGLGEERTAINMSPTRSTEAQSGQDKYGKRTFECPECHELNLREYNQLLRECQHCGSKKVAC